MIKLNLVSLVQRSPARNKTRSTAIYKYNESNKIFDKTLNKVFTFSTGSFLNPSLNLSLTTYLNASQIHIHPLRIIQIALLNIRITNIR